jgi:hypothetical protein
MADISQLLKSTGTKVQNSAQFGAAVEDFTRGKLGAKPATGRSIDPNRSRDDPFTWVSTSYAAALAGGTSYRPKLKFMFKVEFVFTQEALNLHPELKSQDFTFMIQYVDRPKVEFEYEEDINQYNFRTKVLKKITHRELTIKFLDDTGNRVFDFFRIMMFLNSPITRGALEREELGGRLDPSYIQTQLINGNGMSFTSAGGGGFLDNAHRGVINGSVGGVGGSIAAIRVRQIFIGSNTTINDTSTIQLSPQEVVFDFLNPRIKSFDLDELSHDANDPSVLTMVFDYDWMEMLKSRANIGESPKYNITNADAQTAPVDVSTAGAGGASPAGNGGVFGNIIKGRLGGIVQQITSTAVNRAVKSIAGGGFLGGVASTMANGLVNTASNNLLNGVLTSSLKTGSRGAVPPAASDNTGSGGVNNYISSVSAQGATWAGGAEDQPPF